MNQQEMLELIATQMWADMVLKAEPYPEIFDDADEATKRLWASVYMHREMAKHFPFSEEATQ